MESETKMQIGKIALVETIFKSVAALLIFYFVLFRNSMSPFEYVILSVIGCYFVFSLIGIVQLIRLKNRSVVA